MNKIKTPVTVICLLAVILCDLAAQPSTDSLFMRLNAAEPQEKVNIYLAIAKANWRCSTDSIYKYSKKALDLANETGNSNGKAKALVYIGVTHFYRADYDSALYYYEEATRIFRENDVLGEAAIVINNTGVIYKRFGDYQKALQCYNEAMSIQESLGDVKEIGGILLNIGNIYYSQYELDETLKYYFMALEKFESINNKVKIASALSNIGEIYAELNKNDKALEYYQKALILQNETDDKYGIANSLMNIGILETDLNNFTEAEDYLNRSAELYNEMQDKDAITYILTYLADMYDRTGQWNKAFDTYQKTMKIQKSIGNEEGLSFTKLSLAKLLFGKKKWEEAKSNLRTSIELAQKLHVLNVLQDSYLLLSRIDSAQNRNIESLYNFKKYSLYKDSIYNEKSSRQIAEMQTKYETTKKEQEIDRLQQEKILREINIKRKRIIWLFILGTTIILFLFLFILYRLKQRKKETRLLIKNTLETEDKERKYFAEELHDGIGPLLSTVKLYINELDDETANSSTKTLIEESNKIIDEAVNATRNLSHNLMPQDIEKNGLVKSLQIFANRICLKGNQEIHFDNGKLSDYGKWQQVLIYRIITELLTNSIKHAATDSVFISMIEKGKYLTIIYKDEGKGFAVNETLESSKGIGIKNIVSRVNSLNGHVSFNSSAGNGFKARIRFDIKYLCDVKS